MFPGKPLVQITWFDACSDSARMHHDVETVVNYVLPTMHNVGYILHENDVRVMLAHGKGSSGEIDFFAIPVSCIIDRVELHGEEENEAEEDQHDCITVTANDSPAVTFA